MISSVISSGPPSYWAGSGAGNYTGTALPYSVRMDNPINETLWTLPLGYYGVSVNAPELPASSTAVALGAPVEYRNVTVGTVESQGRSVPGGFVVLTLHMQSQMLAAIPAQVRATETPCVNVSGIWRIAGGRQMESPGPLPKPVL